MYRVLIVDDESYIVDWISALLESQTELELDVCRAYSAAEALSWLNRAKTDIIITDIRMPDMSGIALAEKVRQNWPQCKVIMLTAYAEFDYACEAIKNGVMSYILKTEDDEHILAEVKKAVTLLENELNNLQLINEAQGQLKDSMSLIRKEILLSILKGEYNDISELFRQLGNIGVSISPKCPLMLLIGRIENGLPDMNILERFRKFNGAERITEHYLEKFMQCYPVEFGYNKIVWLLQPTDELAAENGDHDSRDFYRHAAVFVNGTLETIQLSCRETLNMSISFALHGAPLQPEELPDVLQSLDHLINLHTADKTGFIISDTGVTDTLENGRAISALNADKLPGAPNITEKLMNYLTDNRQDEFMAELKKICEVLSKSTSWHDNSSLELYFSVANTLMSFINQRKLDKEIAFKIGLNGLFRPYMAGTWSSAADYLCRLAAIIFDIQKEDEGQLSNTITRFLKDYITKHITEDISLVKLSEVTGYNSSYLSRFFKRSTGETLNEYISRQKISKIKELFSDSGLNISDVAVKAGFDSRTYFNRFIRKNTGMSPQELRDHILHG